MTPQRPTELSDEGPAAAMPADGAVDEMAHVAQLELGPLPMEVSTMRIDGWDPGKEHASLSY